MAKTTTNAVAEKKGDLVDRLIDLVIAEIPEAKARADEIKRRMRDEFGGSEHWVSTGWEGNARDRSAALRSAFSGRNVNELARMFGCSRATVYRAIKSRRE